MTWWTTLIAWQRTDGNRGHSLARVEQRSDGWLCHGTEVVAGPEELWSCHFRIGLDSTWQTREVEATAVARGGASTMTLRVDDQRRWWRDGVREPGLDGCIDVDVAATPLTNTFPIRRLATLPVGGESTSPVAWIQVPGLEVLRVDQTYQRLGPLRWRYSDPRHGAFELQVDDDGLVVDYEGFATRVAG